MVFHVVASRGFATGALSAVGPGVIEKTIVRPPHDDADLWKNEVRFYSEFGREFDLAVVRVPRFLGVEEVDDTTLRLRIEHIEDCRPVVRKSARVRLVEGFGALAGVAHVNRLERAVWLPRQGGVGPTARLPSKAEIVLRLLGEVGARCWPSFESFLAASPAVNRAYRSCTPTLGHGDASYGNVLAISGSERFVALDWARVNSGMIGDDLCRLIYPWLITTITEDIPRIEGELVDHYIAGVLSVAPTVDPRLIVRAYEIRSVVLSIGIAAMLHGWLDGAGNSAERAGRSRRVRSYYELMARRALNIATK